MGRRRATLPLLAAAVASVLASSGADASGPRRAADWPLFGANPARSDRYAGATGISRRDLHRLRRTRVRLPGVADSSPIYLRGVSVHGRRHDVYVLDTTYGITVAVDAARGRLLWRYDPPGVRSLEGGSRITESSPVADPEHRFVYTTGPDGLLHKLSLSDGAEQRGAQWPARITLDPRQEKIDSALNLSGRFVYATTSSYLDTPPYQGHVVAVDRDSGAVAGVTNAVCANLHVLLVPTSCPQSGGSIWARSGVVVEPGSGRLLVTTANAPWNGVDALGDSVLELSPDALQVIQGWTPTNQARLNADDKDLGSSGPALLPYRGRMLVLQAGKDGELWLLDGARLGGAVGPHPQTGGQLETLRPPNRYGFFSAPAVWPQRGTTVAFVANQGGTIAYRVSGSHPHLVRVWANHSPGTSPVLAGGLLYVYDFVNGRLNVLDPASGHRLAVLAAAPGHFSTPVVAGGRIALPTGAAYRQQRSGTLYLFSRR